jgi:hypothetical protein
MNKDKLYKKFLEITSITKYMNKKQDSNAIIIDNEDAIINAIINNYANDANDDNDSNNNEGKETDDEPTISDKKNLENELIELCKLIDIGVWKQIDPERLTTRALKNIISNYKK